MNAWRFILASLRHYRRIHLAVALGVAVATAVLTGALLVGDSMRGSLRDLTLQRLGRIDSALVAGQMFRAALAGELAADKQAQQHFAAVEPAILLTATLQAGNGPSARRATGATVVGCRSSFWELGTGGPRVPLAGDEAALTQSLAEELGVREGDSILVRIPVAKSIPADSTLGEKSDTSRSRTVKVSAVLADAGLARFGLAPTQQLPRNVFLPLGTLEQLLDARGRANVLLIATADEREAGDEAALVLRQALRPALEDYGLRVEQIASPTPCLQLSGDQLVLPDEVVRAMGKVMSAHSAQPVVTYLANTITAGDGSAERKIPYSTIVGVDSTPELGPLLDDRGQPIRLADDEIALSDWAAEDLGVKVGDTIGITFYEPESTHGRLREHVPPPSFKLRAIVPLKNAQGQPTRAADPKLTPELPGVTDQQSISDWDLPFELVETIRSNDEDYWDEHRTTPKAFVSLATTKRLWPSRWGTISLIRLPAESMSQAELAEHLRHELQPIAPGMTLLAVKQQGLAASSGTTPFQWLFLGFSFFLIAAAVMLIALLFQLGIEQRASELGTLAALGTGRRRMTGLLVREGLLVAAVGSALGVLAGIFYAWLMIFGLRTWWLAAISTPFIRLHVSPLSLLAGGIVGLVVSLVTIRWSIRRLARLSAVRLLSGATSDTPLGAAASSAPAKAKSRIWSWPALRVVLGAAALAACGAGFFLRGEAQAGSFFASGAAMLALMLGEIRYRLRKPGSIESLTDNFSLLELAALNTTRNPGRSTLTIGLVAAASFLIIAVSAFRLNTGEGGTGGFEYVARSDLAIHFDLNTPAGRQALGFSEKDERLLDAWRVYSVRVAAGEDASCLNLYQPTQPRVLGVPAALIQRGGFDWAEVAKPFRDRPWTALAAQLERDANGARVVPVVLDKSTAVYSLHLKGVGSRLEIRDEADRPVTLEVVGLLSNSVLQGNLLVSEENFLRMFPGTAGYRFFLIDAKQEDASEVTGSLPAVLESALATEGFDVVKARDQLAQFLAVQNTYLSTFQSLGALGLLLGTVGLAIVQLRSVLERRGELALMRAGGFPRRRLAQMVIGENAVLLLGGLLVGGLAAAVALVPQWAPQGASLPWKELTLLLGLVTVAGLVAGWLATRSVLRAPIVAALRGD